MSDFTIRPRKKRNYIDGADLINQVTYEKIDDLQEYIKTQIEEDTDSIETIVDKIMYKVLLFCVSNNCSNEKILKQEAMKYINNNKDLIDTIP